MIFISMQDMPEELFEIPQIETLKLRNNPIQEMPSGNYGVLCEYYNEHSGGRSYLE